MSEYYHIITCDNETAFNNFINMGMLGIRPVKAKSNNLNFTVGM